MTRQRNLLIQMAVAIHEALHAKAAAQPCLELPTTAWQACDTLQRRLRRATQRDWQLAAARIRGDLRAAVDRLCVELAELDRILRPPRQRDHKASVADIHADLVALHEEFEKVTCDRRARTLSVTTEPIELEGIYLGPFEIRLDWSQLPDGHPYNYAVIAVDANPAAANDSVTHPHIQDETVCEGEGSQPIRKALAQGRLLDFFLLVANLLRTYNPSSPYVSLSEWDGVECADCGSNIQDDERWVCERCETTICRECYYHCGGCAGIFCHECMARCDGCDESYCSGCLSCCSQCRAETCRHCLDNNERCNDCHDRELEEPTEEPEDDRSGDVARDPLQPDRLGQAAVPA